MNIAVAVDKNIDKDDVRDEKNRLIEVLRAIRINRKFNKGNNDSFVKREMQLLLQDYQLILLKRNLDNVNNEFELGNYVRDWIVKNLNIISDNYQKDPYYVPQPKGNTVAEYLSYIRMAKMLKDDLHELSMDRTVRYNDSIYETVRNELIENSKVRLEKVERILRKMEEESDNCRDYFKGV